MSLALALLAACAGLLAACDAQFTKNYFGLKHPHPDPNNPLICTTAQYGTVLKGTKTTLPTMIIEPEIRKFTIYIPTRCPENGQDSVGVLVKVCDDARPVVTIPTPDKAVVSRVGSIKDYVPITVTLFCE